MFEAGEYVIYTSPLAKLDGLRGRICAVYPGGYYDVFFEEINQVWEKVWESKLERDTDTPDYPHPQEASE